MRKYVDIDGSEDITEFAFTNFHGQTESVMLCEDNNSCLSIKDDNQEYSLFKRDVPNMIKALQAAYDEWGEE